MEKEIYKYKINELNILIGKSNTSSSRKYFGARV